MQRNSVEHRTASHEPAGGSCVSEECVDEERFDPCRVPMAILKNAIRIVVADFALDPCRSRVSHRAAASRGRHRFLPVGSRSDDADSRAAAGTRNAADPVVSGCVKRGLRDGVPSRSAGRYALVPVTRMSPARIRVSYTRLVGRAEAHLRVYADCFHDLPTRHGVALGSGVL